MKIHDVRHGNTAADRNQYCGPSAISALTGMSSGQAARLLRYVSGKRSIKGSSTGSVQRALAMCGVRTNLMPVKVEYFTNKKGQRKTRGIDSLASWLKKTVKLRTTGRVFLLVAGNHWQIISGRRYVCGQSGEIVSINDKKVKRRAKVTEVYECISNEIRIPEQANPSRTDIAIRNVKNREVAEFRKFARQHKLDYRIYPEGGLKYITVEPTALWPDGLETLHYDYEETKGRLQACLDEPSLVEDGYYSE